MLPCGTFSQTLDLENFAMAVDSVVDKTRRRSTLLTAYTTVDASWLDTHSLLHVGRP